MRKVRNCDGAGDGASLHLPFAPELRRCPRSVVRQEHLALLAAFTRWRQLGLTPFGGPLEEQPAWVADLFESVMVRLAERSGGSGKE